jgi:regulatory protein
MPLRRPAGPPRCSAYEALVRALARRPHSRAELRRKLGARGHAREAVEAAIARAEDLHQLEAEGALATRLAAALAARPLATPASVAAKLRTRGLPEAEVRDAVRAAFEGWDARASAWAGVAPGEPAARAARRLTARGFDAEVVAWVVRRLGSGEAGDDM